MVKSNQNKIVVFSRVFYNNTPLKVMEDCIHVGVKFNHNSSYDKQQIYANQQANKRLFSLSSKSRQLGIE